MPGRGGEYAGSLLSATNGSVYMAGFSSVGVLGNDEAGDIFASRLSEFDEGGE